MPVVGHVIILGPLVSWVVEAIGGAVIGGGLSAIGAALYSIGITKNSVIEYEAAIKADKLLLIAHGNRDEVRQARDVLATTGADRMDVHEMQGAEAEGSTAR